MNGTPTFPSLTDLLMFLRSPDLRLDIPQHYGHGDEWEQKGWLDILARLRTASQLAPSNLNDLARIQVDPFAGPPNLFQVAVQEEPDHALQQLMLSAPGPWEDILRLLQQGPPVTPPPQLVPPAPTLTPLYKQLSGDTLFYGNLSPPSPWSR